MLVGQTLTYSGSFFRDGEKIGEGRCILTVHSERALQHLEGEIIVNEISNANTLNEGDSIEVRAGHTKFTGAVGTRRPDNTSWAFSVYRLAPPD